MSDSGPGVQLSAKKKSLGCIYWENILASPVQVVIIANVPSDPSTTSCGVAWLAEPVVHTVATRLFRGERTNIVCIAEGWERMLRQNEVRGGVHLDATLAYACGSRIASIGKGNYVEWSLMTRGPMLICRL